MRTVTRHVVLLASLLAVSGFGQQASGPNRTNTLANGRLWQTLDENSKMSYVLGCEDGLFFGSLFTGNGNYTSIPDMLKTPAGLKLDEVAKEIDTFYSEGVNAPVPIVYALYYVTRKAAGDTPEQLKEVAAKMRRLALPTTPEKK